MLSILATDDPIEHLTDVPWRIAGHDLPWLSSQTAMLILAALLLGTIIPMLASRALRRGDNAGLGLVEILLSFIDKHIASITLGPAAPKATPVLATLFLFLLIVNLLGIVPFMDISLLLGLDGWGGLDAAGRPLNVTPVGGTPTGGIWVAAVFAVMTFLLVMFSGYMAQVQLLWKGREPDEHAHGHEPVDPGANVFLAVSTFLQKHTWPLPVAVVGGLWTWLNSFVPPIPGAVGVLMWPILLFLELSGYVTKCFALCIRLVANMTSGHLMLAVVLAFAQGARGWGNLYVGVPAGAFTVVLMVMELFVAVLQAYLFTFLSALFIGMSLNPQH